MMTTVLTFGTFDIFHPGHVHYLRKAKKLGDTLITIVARDETVKKVKGRLPTNNQLKRISTVKEAAISDIVELGHPTNYFIWLEKYQPDIIALGYDQKSFVDGLREYIKKNNDTCSIVTISAYKPDIYKSAKLQNN